MSDTIGFIILAHDNSERVVQVAHHLIDQGAPIAIHLDRKTTPADRKTIHQAFASNEQVVFVEETDCRWGGWGIVEAEIKSCKALLSEFPSVEHIYNLSGHCLPVRPLAELSKKLAEEETPPDLIESIMVREQKWVFDGLDAERLEFYHPFDWKKQRRLFDLNVKVQRLIGFKRKIPEGISPSFGSQWWCLSRETLEKIFADPQFESYCKFFGKSWIPDESFFQTLARKHSTNLHSKSPSFVSFDYMGKPVIFYDDHLNLLKSLDHFAIRKVWPGADKLYDHFLSKPATESDPSAEVKLRNHFEQVRHRCLVGREGLISQFTYTKPEARVKTREKYHLAVGFDRWLDEIYEHYLPSQRIQPFGNLFHPSRTELEIGENLKPKRAPSLTPLRNYEPFQFLQQRIWLAHPKQILISTRAHHLQAVTRNIISDEHAMVYFVRGAWFLDVFERNRKESKRLQGLCAIHIQREEKFMRNLELVQNQSRIHITTLGEMIAEPEKTARNFPEKLSLSDGGFDLRALLDFRDHLRDLGIVTDQLDLHHLEQKLQKQTLKKPAEEMPESTNVIPIKKAGNI